MAESAEQKARDLLEYYGLKDAQSMSAGDVVELANLIADANAYRQGNAALGPEWQTPMASLPEPAPGAEHWVWSQMICGSCHERMGMRVTAGPHMPSVLSVTCAACGYVNTWRAV